MKEIDQIIAHLEKMGSVSAMASRCNNAASSSFGVEKLPDEMNDMKIRDDKVRCAVAFNVLCFRFLVIIIFE